MPTDLKRLMKKLQMALSIQQGRHISVSIYQMFSQKAGRNCSKYVISEQHGEGGYKKLLESWNLPEVVKFLAAEYERGKNT